MDEIKVLLKQILEQLIILNESDKAKMQLMSEAKTLQEQELGKFTNLKANLPDNLQKMLKNLGIG